MPNTISAPSMPPSSPRRSSGAKSMSARLMSATVTGMSMARHSARYMAALSRLLLTLVSRADMYSAG